MRNRRNTSRRLRIAATLVLLSGSFCASLAVAFAAGAQSSPYLELMQKAWTIARSHGAKAPPILSPDYSAVLKGEVPIESLHRNGFVVVPGTTSEPGKLKALIGAGSDGIITDRPDILRKLVDEALSSASGSERERLARFDVEGHRGGRGLRPENTLPAFESGLDQMVTTLETDTGITTDGVALIWHDQFLNPRSCRHTDGSPYTAESRAYTRDLSLREAQRKFICDKLYFGSSQVNDLSLSPVAVAFARKEKLISPYVPTYLGQLFRFVRFYAEYYRSGPGKSAPEAAARVAEAERVRFNIETKIRPARPSQAQEEGAGMSLPAKLFDNHTVSPERFVQVLGDTILRNGMESRAQIQSFDFRTLLLIEQQHPSIRTFYLVSNPALLSTAYVPVELRLPAAGISHAGAKP